MGNNKMIERHEYMLELKRRLLELPHVTSIKGFDSLFMVFETEGKVDFEIKMPGFNTTRFMITFDCGVVGSNSCIGNMSYKEFVDLWEDIYQDGIAYQKRIGNL